MFLKMVTRGNSNYFKPVILPPTFFRSGFGYKQTNKQMNNHNIFIKFTFTGWLQITICLLLAFQSGSCPMSLKFLANAVKLWGIIRKACYRCFETVLLPTSFSYIPPFFIPSHIALVLHKRKQKFEEIK